jgi:hypothetical protein
MKEASQIKDQNTTNELSSLNTSSQLCNNNICNPVSPAFYLYKCIQLMG